MEYLKYECRTGCGHVFLLSKPHNSRDVSCPLCKRKSILEYKGRFEVKEFEITNFSLRRKF